ncbi:MAG: NIPSNAP family protein [Novosphingobium sp.]
MASADGVGCDPVFVHVELKIAPGQMARFLDTMQVVAPLMGEAGWNLVGAWRVRVGEANMLRVIWKMASAQVFFGDRPSLVNHPRFSEFRSLIDAAVLEERVTMMSAVPYGQSVPEICV